MAGKARKSIPARERVAQQNLRAADAYALKAEKVSPGQKYHDDLGTVVLDAAGVARVRAGALRLRLWAYECYAGAR